MTQPKSAPRTYNQTHVPRKYSSGGDASVSTYPGVTLGKPTGM
jgi:hypothetical protein